MLLGESEGDGFLVGVRAVEVQQRDTFRLGQPFGLAAKGLREVQGMVGVLLKEDALLVEVTLDARGMVEQARLTAKAEAVEAGQNEMDQGTETG